MRSMYPHRSFFRTYGSLNLIPLHGKALPTAASTGCIGIVERKSLAFKTAGKLQCGVEQVQKTLEVGDHFDAVVFKNLIVGLRFIVEIHLVRQARTASARDAHPNEIVIANVFFGLDFLNFGLGGVSYKKHDAMSYT